MPDSSQPIISISGSEQFISQHFHFENSKILFLNCKDSIEYIIKLMRNIFAKGAQQFTPAETRIHAFPEIKIWMNSEANCVENVVSPWPLCGSDFILIKKKNNRIPAFATSSSWMLCYLFSSETSLGSQRSEISLEVDEHGKSANVIRVRRPTFKRYKALISKRDFWQDIPECHFFDQM